MPVASRLTLAIRTALLLAAASGNAWAATAESTDDSAQSLTLDATNVNARYLGPTDLPEVLAGGQVARGARLGMLGNKDVMDTPFSVTSYTAKTLADLQTVTVADALERDPSVRSTGQTGGIVDSFFVRGFAIGEGNLGELAYDGVYGVAPNYRAFTEYAERVEVLKGPGALMYGISPNSGVGGVINIVPKRPLDQDLTRFTGSYASDTQVGGHLDISRRFGEENQFGVRFNGSLQGGDTAVDDQHRDVGVGAIALDYRGERLRLNLDYISQKESFEGASRPFTLAPGVQVPSAPNGRTSLPQKWGWSDTKEQSALLGGEYDLSDSLTVFAHAGGGRSDVKRLSDQVPRILNDAGDTSNIPGYYKFNVDRSTADVGLRAQFATGPITHTTTLMATRYQDELSRGINNGTEIRSNIYHPVDTPKQNLRAPKVLRISESELSGVALTDTLGFLDERIQLTLGVRRQDIESRNYNAAGAVSSRYKDAATTPLVGVVVKPWDDVSLYYNYVEGLSKGDIAPGTASNAGETFAPYESKQHELGVKYEHGTLMTTLALFQIEKPSGELGANGVYSVQAEQRNRGVELSVYGEVAPGTRLMGGVTFLDGELTQSASAANRGNKPVGVPDIQANLWAEYDTPWLEGFTLTGGAIYTDSQYVNQANTQELDAWTRIDAGVRYATKIEGRPTTLRATVQNVFDREYWSGVASYGAFSPGYPRTLQLSATVDF
ncbi:MAG: energy transducer TonB [Pseudomonadales bacterium RIFCSPLOWO2_12_60_38]|jgi:iron complex outermembrane recepter protein|uniref:TonB-dependent outermembrane receptor n=8 Tax=Pseudomonas TaxID=286 RepID=I4KDK1_9PSED|nr:MULTISPECIES: TonB-dependent siderophore receptor [Pseudomonas]AFJ59113.1 TonB-dependent outermembrane receptor [Pseudomonas fluorescens A506]ETK39764.1 TonB dependent/Ligand-Gated channel TonB [Pseudomonas fluorescens FH5]MBD8558310.1 TonB-dependent siderophore receptor [Pseudomonas fluorescens]MDN5431391.1 TonB-dependent siderophore receptor [Pseudomonadales bacterium]OHC34770.1 MAG: energy transducer TonB [Pseudomonadales bacterium RIFCSPLOWO2_12_60_38]OHC38645.1 MAG: energy transducer 